MGQELVDLRHAHVFGIVEVVKEDELARLMGVGIYTADRGMLQVGLVAQLVEQFHRGMNLS